ncbi:hypothetical protein DPX39_100021000 [Trypanosoma brucei equiperdum]|uniref:Uncharacterized protein n=1 Tax=Trypanosoma brucei equiperdum TaxID=630700 RepID=A0A3L6KYS1_9TRYP|nr:hypothetical protein DPX39_100021000 [Trypanosoma brucei equiperdum]
MPTGHVIYDDDGEVFEEDVTVGRGVPPDVIGRMEWLPLVAEPPTEEMKALLRKVLAELAETA